MGTEKSCDNCNGMGYVQKFTDHVQTEVCPVCRGKRTV